MQVRHQLVVQPREVAIVLKQGATVAGLPGAGVLVRAVVHHRLHGAPMDAPKVRLLVGLRGVVARELVERRRQRAGQREHTLDAGPHPAEVSRQVVHVAGVPVRG